MAAATYVAARVLGTWELYLVALAFAAMTALAWVLVLAGARRLQVDRQGRARAAPSPATRCASRSGYGAAGASPGCRSRWRTRPARLGGPSEPIVLEGLGIRGVRVVSAGPWPARRGVHRLPALAAVVEDPLGLARARRPAGEPLRVTVAPRLDELASCSPCADYRRTPRGRAGGACPRAMPGSSAASGPTTRASR